MDISKRELFTQSLGAGFQLLRGRLGLVALLYGFDLLVAVLLGFPIYNAVVEHVGITGFGPDLIQRFDLVLWREILDGLTEAFKVLGIQLLIVIPVYWIWKTASRMGVIYALHQGGIWPFWRGVGYYTGKGLLLGLLFLPVKAIAAAVAVMIGLGIINVWTGEVGAFWSMAVILPFLVIAALATIDLFQRYARIAVVVRHDTVWRAFSAGLSWPLKYGAASYLYIAWFMFVLLIFGMTQGLNALLHVGVSAVVVAFLIQQVSLFTREAATVGWIGSEVSLFERTHIHELPLIAEDEQVGTSSDAHSGDDALGGVAFT
ncbi:MAG: hypothetical protein AAF564_01965 [Bacteroidota bacterium]